MHNFSPSNPKLKDELTVNGVGIQCFVFQNGNLLLGKRKNAFGEGTWGLPGGHLEKGETILEAASRELFEETGLIFLQGEIVAISDAISENNYHLQIGVLINRWTGLLSNKEPEVCSDLDFFAFDDLPLPLFVSSTPLIENYKLKKLY